MKNPCCIQCDNELERWNRVYSTPEGFVCEECMEEYVEERWEELNLVNKLQLLGMSTDCRDFGEVEDGNRMDYEYEERAAV